jgi:hypothetical protein
MCLLNALLCALGGVVVGCSVGFLLTQTDWLADPGGAIVILLLVVVGGLGPGIYGFFSTLNRIQKRQISSN